MRADGTRIKNADPMYTVAAYIMNKRVDSMNMIDISILKKSLDAVEQNGDFLIQMMEQSINPNLGSNIDIRL